MPGHHWVHPIKARTRSFTQDAISKQLWLETRIRLKNLCSTHFLAVSVTPSSSAAVGDVPAADAQTRKLLLIIARHQALAVEHYAAEIQNLGTGGRVWLGTFNTAEEVASTYDTTGRVVLNFPATHPTHISSPLPLQSSSVMRRRSTIRSRRN